VAPSVDRKLDKEPRIMESAWEWVIFKEVDFKEVDEINGNAIKIKGGENCLYTR
jgi:hypothetical protein